MNFYARFLFICWLALANILNLTHNGSQGNILQGVEIKSTEKCLTSPGYPEKYPDNSNTIDTLSVEAGQSIEISFVDFKVEEERTCAWDSLHFQDENENIIGKKLCGDSLPEKLIIPTSTAFAVFNSDGSVTKKGYEFCYQPVQKNCLTSPRYPEAYPDNSNTIETFSVEAGKSIEISFVDFKVEEERTCAWDSLHFQDENENIIGKKMCGDSLPQKLIIPTSTAFAVFNSDGSVTKKGYEFCYKPVQMTPQCGIENNGRRISGGNVTRPNQYPWMVHLYLPKTNGFFGGCGGALITDRHVLTAKHCVDDHKIIKGDSRVKYSVHNQYDPSDYQQVSIKNFVWPKGTNHDIAIIVLDNPVNLNDKTVGTVCLPANKHEDYRGENAIAMGWGMTAVGSGGSPILKHVDLTVSQQQEKNWLYTEVPRINGVPQDPCSGDSGGPLVHKDTGTGRWTIIGTVFGNGFNCRDGTFKGKGKWNKVTDHLAWINDIIRH